MFDPSPGRVVVFTPAPAVPDEDAPTPEPVVAIVVAVRKGTDGAEDVVDLAVLEPTTIGQPVSRLADPRELATPTSKKGAEK